MMPALLYEQRESTAPNNLELKERPKKAGSKLSSLGKI